MAKGKPLKGEPWTWQRGEIDPQRQAAEVVEVVRNDADDAVARRELRCNDAAG